MCCHNLYGTFYLRNKTYITERLKPEAILDKNEIYCEILVLRSRRGDSRAFSELVGIFERRLLYYLRRLTNDEQEAWDILQQVWLKVIRGIGSIKNPRKFKSWLYMVAHHTTVDRISQLAREKVLQDETCPDEMADNNSELEHFESADLVHYGLGKLPVDQREIMTLFFLEEFSIAEISDILNLPDGTVKSRLHRARKALRSILTEEGGRQ